ncbi:hypothetical protein RhiTH_006919, partial [Rhizoctonia solani]
MSWLHRELSAKNAAALNKRPRPVGYLVPDVLFNQQMEDISWENKGWDLGFDTKVDLFIIAGTALKTPGTFKLVKAMAQNTQKYGGIVVYLNRAKPSKSLSSFIDVHFQIEADLFPDFFNKINREEFTPGTESIREQAIKAFDQISRLTPQQLLPIAELSSNHEYDVETQTQKRIPFFTKIKLIIFYTPQHGMEVDKYGQQLMQRLHEQEYQVELSQIRIGSFNNIPVVESQGFHVLYVFLTSSGVDRHAAPASQDMEVAEMLYLTRYITPPSSGVLSTKAVIIGYYNSFFHLTLAQRLDREVGQGTTDTILCGLALASSNYQAWADWTAQIMNTWTCAPIRAAPAEQELQT